MKTKLTQLGEQHPVLTAYFDMGFTAFKLILCF
jgi:hypothetical protein